MNLIKYICSIILVFNCFGLFADGKRFSFEIGGNIFSVSPQHYNYFVENEVQYLQFFFDKFYKNKTEEGEITPLESLFASNARLKYALTPSLHVSIGFTYLWKTKNNPYTVIYTQDQGWRTITDKLEYQVFDMKVEGVIPTLGIHYQIPISAKTKIEGSLTGGPIFASVKHTKERNQSIVSTSRSNTFPFFDNSQSMVMEGSGTGISLSGSLKLSQHLSKSMSVFLEGGYAWQRISKISGDGRASQEGVITTWSGDWGIVKEEATKEWGKSVFKFPHNNWNDTLKKSEDFILDLSGFYLAVGFGFRF